MTDELFREKMNMALDYLAAIKRSLEWIERTVVAGSMADVSRGLKIQRVISAYIEMDKGGKDKGGKGQ